MLSKITLTKPDIPTVLEMTDAVPRSYSAGSRFLLQCTPGSRVLILEGLAVTEQHSQPLELCAGDLVSFTGECDCIYPIKVLQKLVFCVK